MTSTVITAALAALIAAAKLPAATAGEIAAAAKVRKPTLPTVVRFATILRTAEAKAKGAALERIRKARALAVTESAMLGYVA